MCVLSNVYLCWQGQPSNMASDPADEEYFRQLMAQVRSDGRRSPIPQRKLTNVRTQHQPRHVQLYDLHGREPEERDFDCVLTKTTPSFHICVYPAAEDRFISAALVSDGVWEPYITPILQKALNKYPDSVFIDVGANIGYYSLMAARMGHHVIAIEPSAQNIARLHQGARLNKVTQVVDLVFTAVSDRHENVTLSENADNQGGIWVRPVDVGSHSHDASRKPASGGEARARAAAVLTTTTMDHLLEVADFSQAVIKIDIEGYECKALAGARRLLSRVYVPYIFMEWKKMYQALRAEHSPCPLEAVRGLTALLVRRGYVPYEVRTGFQLNPERSTTRWRIGDLYWRRTDAKLLQDPF